MKILIVFPKYDSIELLEMGATKKFLSFAEKLIDSCAGGRNTLFFLAENDTARMMREDVPHAKFITFTQEDDLDVLSMSEKYKSCDYAGSIKPLANYGVIKSTTGFKSMQQFEDYYGRVLEESYARIPELMDVIVEFSMPKKYTLFKMKDIPKATIFYQYDIQDSTATVYLNGAPNEEITKLWKGGIPREGER